MRSDRERKCWKAIMYNDLWSGREGREEEKRTGYLVVLVLVGWDENDLLVCYWGGCNDSGSSLFTRSQGTHQLVHQFPLISLATHSSFIPSLFSSLSLSLSSSHTHTNNMYSQNIYRSIYMDTEREKEREITWISSSSWFFYLNLICITTLTYRVISLSLLSPSSLSTTLHFPFQSSLSSSISQSNDQLWSIQIHSLLYSSITHSTQLNLVVTCK